MNGTPRALLIDPDDRSRDAIRQALASSGRVGVVDVSASYQGESDSWALPRPSWS